jgi:hypothetical protein
MAVTEADFNKFVSPGGQFKSLDGGTVASIAGTQTAPQALMTYLTGTNAIVSLSLPWPDFAGEIVVIPSAASTWTTAGNIAKAGTSTANRAISFFYYPPTGKWYPSVTA